MDRVHHLRHAMPLSLWGEIGDQEGDTKSANYRHQDDKRPPMPHCRELRGIVGNGKPAQEKYVMDQSDQRAEDNRAKTRDNADHKGEKRQVTQRKGAVFGVLRGCG